MTELKHTFELDLKWWLQPLAYDGSVPPQDILVNGVVVGHRHAAARSGYGHVIAVENDPHIQSLLDVWVSNIRSCR